MELSKGQVAILTDYIETPEGSELMGRLLDNTNTDNTPILDEYWQLRNDENRWRVEQEIFNEDINS